MIASLLWKFMRLDSPEWMERMLELSLFFLQDLSTHAKASASELLHQDLMAGSYSNPTWEQLSFAGTFFELGALLNALHALSLLIPSVIP